MEFHAISQNECPSASILVNNPTLGKGWLEVPFTIQFNQSFINGKDNT
ncbi:hypothetical protein ACFLT2_04225 [Acidobacteriota bacterium]